VISEKHPFYLYFEKVYGPRWKALYSALLRPEKKVARKNLLSVPPSNISKEWQKLEENQLLPGCFWLDPALEIHPERNGDELLDIYIMDPASVLVARALKVQIGDRVLDMCAAPGGKSLVLIEAMGDSGEIICNDLSPDRRERLKKVIQQYVPRAVRERVRVTGKDGVQFGLREPNTFDSILLDVPCSGERHLLENKSALDEWSPRRTEHLATRQYSLLAAALLALKPGGKMVYSTCSISPLENDGIIQKLFKKKKSEVRLLDNEIVLGGEKTEFGVAFLPDRCGFGPLYFTTIEKQF
jgi:16S rRNA C967 or C1407 C5-methylase (RsmB/RsmF family)